LAAIRLVQANFYDVLGPEKGTQGVREDGVLALLYEVTLQEARAGEVS